MTQGEVVQAMHAIKKQSDEFMSLLGFADKAFGGCLGSPIFEAYFNLEDIALVHLAERARIHPEAMSWFAYENRWGAENLGVLHGGVMIPMDSIETFVAYEMEVAKQ